MIPSEHGADQASPAIAQVYLSGLIRDLGTLLQCPACSGLRMTAGQERLVCADCGAEYPVDVDRQVVFFGHEPDTGAIKQQVQAWWGDLYEQLYAPTDRTLSNLELAARLPQLEELFRLRDHLAVTEMPLGQLRGLRVLEIGPGGGAHSALFKFHGAHVTSIDITPERAVSTALKLSLVADGDGRSYQGDAEKLPFRDGAFDIVYSNGVLHHSPDTDRCIAEVGRVLKPGGRAILMLYSRHSATFWCNILPRGIASLGIFRAREPFWVGRVTEGRPKHGANPNPVTRVYSRRELQRLLAKWKIISLRKSSFQFDNFAIPRLSQIRNRILSLFGHVPHPGGVLVYGGPFHCETSLERALGTVMGFAWNIVAEKPGEAEAPKDN